MPQGFQKKVSDFVAPGGDDINSSDTEIIESPFSGESDGSEVGGDTLSVESGSAHDDTVPLENTLILDETDIVDDKTYHQGILLEETQLVGETEDNHEKINAAKKDSRDTEAGIKPAQDDDLDSKEENTQLVEDVQVDDSIDEDDIGETQLLNEDEGACDDRPRPCKDETRKICLVDSDASTEDECEADELEKLQKQKKYSSEEAVEHSQAKNTEAISSRSFRKDSSMAELSRGSFSSGSLQDPEKYPHFSTNDASKSAYVVRRDSSNTPYVKENASKQKREMSTSCANTSMGNIGGPDSLGSAMPKHKNIASIMAASLRAGGLRCSQMSPATKRGDADRKPMKASARKMDAIASLEDFQNPVQDAKDRTLRTPPYNPFLKTRSLEVNILNTTIRSIETSDSEDDKDLQSVSSARVRTENLTARKLFTDNDPVDILNPSSRNADNMHDAVQWKEDADLLKFKDQRVSLNPMLKNGNADDVHATGCVPPKENEIVSAKPDNIHCDKEPEYHHVSAGLSYLDSQEPGEESKAKALNTVDKLVWLNTTGFSQDVEQQGLSRSSIQKFPKPIDIKRQQRLAQLVEAKSPKERSGVFDWVDSQNDEVGAHAGKCSSSLLLKLKGNAMETQTKPRVCRSRKVNEQYPITETRNDKKGIEEVERVPPSSPLKQKCEDITEVQDVNRIRELPGGLNISASKDVTGAIACDKNLVSSNKKKKRQTTAIENKPVRSSNRKSTQTVEKGINNETYNTYTLVGRERKGRRVNVPKKNAPLKDTINYTKNAAKNIKTDISVTSQGKKSVSWEDNKEKMHSDKRDYELRNKLQKHVTSQGKKSVSWEDNKEKMHSDKRDYELRNKLQKQNDKHATQDCKVDGEVDNMPAIATRAASARKRKSSCLKWLSTVQAKMSADGSEGIVDQCTRQSGKAKSSETTLEPVDADKCMVKNNHLEQAENHLVERTIDSVTGNKVDKIQDLSSCKPTSLGRKQKRRDPGGIPHDQINHSDHVCEASPPTENEPGHTDVKVREIIIRSTRKMKNMIRHQMDCSESTNHGPTSNNKRTTTVFKNKRRNMSFKGILSKDKVNKDVKSNSKDTDSRITRQSMRKAKEHVSDGVLEPASTMVTDTTNQTIDGKTCQRQNSKKRKSHLVILNEDNQNYKSKMRNFGKNRVADDDDTKTDNATLLLQTPKQVRLVEKGSKSRKSTAGISSKKQTLMSSLKKELAELNASSSIAHDSARKRRKPENILVLFSHGLDSNLVKHQQKILSRLGGQVTSSAADCTHFVTDKFVRTKNMLQTMAAGKPVVTPLWLENSGQASTFIDEKRYILEDVKKEKEMRFSMSASLASAQKRPLLQGKLMYITPNTKPDRDSITSLVTAAQGQVLDNLEGPLIKAEDLEHLIVISDEDDRGICIPLIDKGVRIHSSEFLFDSIVRQNLDFSREKLFTDETHRT